MAYRFEPTDRLAEQVRAIAGQQLRRLVRYLNDPHEVATGHHATRKCIKRLRALLALSHGALGRRMVLDIDTTLRRIGRALSGRRDAVVLQHIVDTLRSDPEGAALMDASAAQPAAQPNGAEPSGAAPDMPGLLRLATPIDVRIALAPVKHVSAAQLLVEVRREYGAGRRAMKVAYRTQDPDDLHDLRKHVQRHQRHMQLLAMAWPEAFHARIDLARAIAGHLGDDHDLALFRSAYRPALAKDVKRRARDPLDRLCRDRQHASRLAARVELRKLYAERPKAFAKRILSYWEAAGATGKQDTGAVVSAASPSKVKPAMRQATS